MSLKIYTPFYFFCFTIVLLLSNSFNSNAQTYFAPEQNISSGNGTLLSSQIVDLNGDGYVDMLISSDYAVSWYKNDGTGSFSSEKKIAEVSGVYFICTADFDNDGDIDILFSADWIETTSWYKNDGAGNFSNPQIISSIAMQAIYSVDFDNDGNIDIIGKTSNDIVKYKNTGNGNFIQQENIANSNADTNKMSIGDLDNDNDIDVIFYNIVANNVVWYKNDGVGNFIDEQTIVEAVNFDFLLIIDLDNDGNNDLVGITYFNNNLVWYKNNGTENFNSQQIVFSPVYAKKIDYADLDNDNDIDLITGNNFSDGLVWFENDGSENFSNHIVIPPIQMTYTVAVVATDINNDNKVDLFYAGGGYYGAFWYENDGNGNFTNLTYITSYLDDLSNIYVSDINSDGYKDIFAQSSSLVWFKNNGDTNFSSQQVIDSLDGEYFYFADFDNDNDVDVLSYYQSFYQASVYKNDGIGNFSLSQNMFDTNFNTLKVFINDIDNDNDLDIIVYFSNDMVMKLYKNDGAGYFDTEEIIYQYIDSIDYLKFVDIDNDFDLDMVSFLLGSDEVIWYENDGTNHFYDEQTLLIASIGISKINLSDINNDNKIDVILHLFSANTIVWFKNEGTSFAEEQIITSNVSEVNYMSIKDLDNDNKPDIIFDSYGTIFWYKNNGNGNFDNYRIISTSDNLSSRIYTDDLDNDGDLDILFIRSDDNILNWHENLLHSPTLHGTVYYDLNQDGQYNNGEYLLQNQTVELMPNFKANYSNSNGYFYVLTTGDHQVAINPNNIWHPTSDTLVNFTASANQDTTINFGLYPNTLTTNIMPYLTSGINRCNQQIPYYLTVSNQGTNVDALSVVKLHPDAQLVYQNATPAPDSISTDGSLYWHIDSLIPTQQSNFVVLFQAPTSDSVGDTLSVLASVKTYNNFNQQVNYNAFTYNPIVSCAVDPNDKQVSPLGVQAQNYTLISNTNELVYTVRFQNTGNDTAFRVMISDQLSYYLDWSTFRLINSSHAVQVYRLNSGVIQFVFDNILLPDSTTNQAGSQGFIQYAIKPSTPVYNGINIKNTAHIFFDQNAAVVTNTVSNTMVFEIPTGINNINAANGFDIIRLTPNPTNSKVQITFVTQQTCNTTLELRDLTGRLVLLQKNKANSGTNTATIDLSPFAQGLYVLVINNGKNIITAKVVKQ